MPHASFHQQRKALESGDKTMTQLMQEYLKGLQKAKGYNAYIETYETEAWSYAAQIDEKIKNEVPLRPLEGLVISVKANIAVTGKNTSAASKMLADYRSPYMATCIDRLVKEGAFIIGITNCDEFGMGSSSENSHYGPVRNAIDPDFVPGGSSGGAAVAVQTHSCQIAIGSDTGGSVRQPAAFCGVYGFKPSYGRISRYGLLAYASSFEQIGFLSQTPEDISLLMQYTAGPDEYDATCLPKKEIVNSSKNYRVAYPPACYDKENEYTNACKNLLEDIFGDHLHEVTLPFVDKLIPCYYILTTAEASSNLGRYDGIRYGHRSMEKGPINEFYSKNRTEGFGYEVKKRILVGSFVLSSGYFDAYYLKAQSIRDRIKAAMELIFDQYDFVVLPTSPTPPWQIGDKERPESMNYLADIYTVLANIIGSPAIHVPFKVKNSKWPNGFQILARPGEDEKIFDFLAQYSEKIR